MIQAYVVTCHCTASFNDRLATDCPMHRNEGSIAAHQAMSNSRRCGMAWCTFRHVLHVPTIAPIDTSGGILGQVYPLGGDRLRKRKRNNPLGANTIAPDQTFECQLKSVHCRGALCQSCGPEGNIGPFPCSEAAQSNLSKTPQWHDSGPHAAD